MEDVPHSTELGDDAWSEATRQPTNRLAQRRYGQFPTSFLTVFTEEHPDLSDLDPQMLDDFERSISAASEDQPHDVGARLRSMRETAKILLAEELETEDL